MMIYKGQSFYESVSVYELLKMNRKVLWTES